MQNNSKFLGILVFIVSVGVGYLYSNMFYNNSAENIKAEQFEINFIINIFRDILWL